MTAWETTVLTISAVNKHKVVSLKLKMEKAVPVILIASQDFASIVFVMEIWKMEKLACNMMTAKIKSVFKKSAVFHFLWTNKMLLLFKMEIFARQMINASLVFVKITCVMVI